MKEKVEKQLASLRKAEVNAKHNFGMPKQSLGDQLKFEQKKAEPEHDLGKLITKIDMAASESATLLNREEKGSGKIRGQVYQKLILLLSLPEMRRIQSIHTCTFEHNEFFV